MSALHSNSFSLTSAWRPKVVFSKPQRLNLLRRNVSNLMLRDSQCDDEWCQVFVTDRLWVNVEIIKRNLSNKLRKMSVLLLLFRSTINRFKLDCESEIKIIINTSSGYLLLIKPNSWVMLPFNRLITHKADPSHDQDSRCCSCLPAGLQVRTAGNAPSLPPLNAAHSLSTLSHLRP